ncbi:MAG: hypothetical protein ACXV3V_10970 [Actinomycetes bacterium]
MTSIATQRCAYAACSKPANTASVQGWVFCDEDAKADEKLKESGDIAALRPAGAPVKSLPPPLNPRDFDDTDDQPAAPAAAGMIGRLLEDASGHTVAKVRNLAARIEGDLDRLRSLIAEHSAAEQARRDAAKAKAAARAEVERLEKQLRAAKAKLRGGTPEPTSSTPARSALDCRKGCGRTVNGPAGRAAHERHCTGTSAA